MNLSSVFLLIAFVLQSVSYIPLAYNIYTTQNPHHIPYTTIYSWLVSGILFTLVSLMNGFYWHSILFIVNAIIAAWLLYVKKYVYIQDP